jgi:hypothetical protein
MPNRPDPAKHANPAYTRRRRKALRPHLGEVFDKAIATGQVPSFTFGTRYTYIRVADVDDWEESTRPKPAEWAPRIRRGDILQREIPTDTVDLIYLDPPFNSKATYNVLFGSPAGSPYNPLRTPPSSNLLRETHFPTPEEDRIPGWDQSSRSTSASRF